MVTKKNSQNEKSSKIKIGNLYIICIICNQEIFGNFEICGFNLCHKCCQRQIIPFKYCAVHTNFSENLKIFANFFSSSLSQLNNKENFSNLTEKEFNILLANRNYNFFSSQNPKNSQKFFSSFFNQSSFFSFSQKKENFFWENFINLNINDTSTINFFHFFTKSADLKISENLKFSKILKISDEKQIEKILNREKNNKFEFFSYKNFLKFIEIYNFRLSNIKLNIFSKLGNSDFSFFRNINNTKDFRFMIDLNKELQVVMDHHNFKRETQMTINDKMYKIFTFQNEKLKKKNFEKKFSTLEGFDANGDFFVEYDFSNLENNKNNDKGNNKEDFFKKKNNVICDEKDFLKEFDFSDNDNKIGLVEICESDAINTYVNSLNEKFQ